MQASHNFVACSGSLPGLSCAVQISRLYPCPKKNCVAIEMFSMSCRQIDWGVQRRQLGHLSPSYTILNSMGAKIQ